MNTQESKLDVHLSFQQCTTTNSVILIELEQLIG